MKHISNILLVVLLSLFVSSCAYDNYDEPKSQLKGKIVYNGTPIGVRGSGSAVQVQLYQDGYAYKTAITAYVNQDGEFSALLFDGEYKIVTKDNNGPWVNSRDTTVVNVKGNTTCELKVTPFFTISDENFTFDGNVVTYTFNVTKVAPTAQLSNVALLVSNTMFVDNAINIARSDVSLVEGKNTLTFDVSSNDKVKSAKYLYARVGVLNQGSSERVYSSVIKIK